ncbi:Multidrug transporter EmrE [Gemmata sp. SH-PL17]|nr:Multidrug transporter EmrE [Gemmata sp. SH-PL17]
MPKRDATMFRHGLLLVVAIACETIATLLLKRSDGMSRLWPSVGMLVGYVAALFLLSLVLKSLPVGPVYAVWSGLGTALTALLGYIAFGDRLPPGAWVGVALVCAGVVFLSVYLPRTD